MNIAKHILVLSLVSFVVHGAWENAHAPLFAGYVSILQHAPACFLATLGDVMFTLFVYLGIALLKRDYLWISRLSAADAVVLMVLGLAFALGIEWRALLQGRWAYTEAMPIIPYVHIGLTPVLQMVILLPLSFVTVARWRV
ncbi:hypothetical protein A3C89_01895 [Candidatus Kaiserbacteria bacterium RIFCSPHIGHO2_02_FULL_50_50]|uniref:Uncharacterized protein n=1 Tax=Candidatus Kaiserbacteria bacterium RIFCSPHIGHO2_02_FULL_50_50 TaxID=1798492 RepID=A0A1F6DCI6_9BACT|nr:MAG: hypothetical protein A3C89_01895 [Candidatus Kaiserbacteria bacterium RIFCSPHIGHO2_02_FULL_50_50]OGG89024.1 MAG: hypothetical protein A3G62_04300 [Candidatus Kaiserbacteria bacterium RIFCSPLOWO2_12_FULL_50_10]